MDGTDKETVKKKNSTCGKAASRYQIGDRSEQVAAETEWLLLPYAVLLSVWNGVICSAMVTVLSSFCYQI